MENNLLLQNNYIVPGIVVIYVFFSTVLGRIIMQNRKPMNLKFVLIMFNGALLVWNVYLVFWIFPVLWKLWPYRCNFVRNQHYKTFYTENETFLWQAFLLKFVELFDTVFFVLRKKYNQISYLHVLHHAMVYGGVGIILGRNEIEYFVLIYGGINFSIHVLMFSYYGLSTIGPHMKKYLWWKKYLTGIQIMQFVIMLCYIVASILIGCDSFEMSGKLAVSGTLVIMTLFINFYVKSYKVKRS